VRESRRGEAMKKRTNDKIILERKEVKAREEERKEVTATDLVKQGQEDDIQADEKRQRVLEKKWRTE